MKVALIDRTGLKALPLAASLRARGHHVVLISEKEHAPFPPSIPLTRCEHHHIGLDDLAQLVTALQNCAAAAICTGDLPGALEKSITEPAEDCILREACRRAGVPQLTHLRFTHAHTGGKRHEAPAREQESSHAA